MNERHEWAAYSDQADTKQKSSALIERALEILREELESDQRERQVHAAFGAFDIKTYAGTYEI
ncbi:hypothetical protein [Paranoxybacillus vitaminiphilus]|uniref:hypothetical protein n=1 Tax=Paranoxybacillus vitaminiphilus TaxID=581036 RepID=UPI000DB91F06|nr:hypothetical protein [Anoxybacillus vitaminiphilus]